MDFQTAVKTCIAKYTDFTGRASRSEFWWFVLAQFGVLVVTGLIHEYVYLIAALALLRARTRGGCAPPARHRQERLVPAADRSSRSINLVLIYFFVQPSQPESNAYGEPPSA